MELICSFFSLIIPGEPTDDNEEGGHPDAQPEAVVQVEEEEGQRRWLHAPRWTFGPLGRRIDGRHHEAAGSVQVWRWFLHLNG